MDVTEIAREDDGRRTLVVVMGEGDEVIESLTTVARTHAIHAASLTAIGALRRLTLGYYQWDRGRYDEIPVEEQVEVASLIGNIASDDDGQPVLHAHGVVGRTDGTALGGHLLRAEVRPTLEVVIEEAPIHLARRHRPELGLALIDLSAGVTADSAAVVGGGGDDQQSGHPGPDLGL